MLGEITPQSVRIAQIAVVYPGRNHVTTLTIKRYDGRSYKPVDLDDLTRAVLVFPGTSPTIAFDSATDSVFTWAGNVLTIDLSDYAMPESIQPSHLIVFDAEHLQGQVLVDNIDSRLEFDFRLVSTTGTTPPPTAEFVTEAPQDGETYGRKDGVWVTLVSGVVSVNGQTGTVVLDAADVGAATAAQGALADSAVQPGDLSAVATSGAYADLSGTPALGTAAAADTGDFDPAGAAAGVVAAHVGEGDPHPQYLTQTEGDLRYERGLTAGTNITIDRTNPDAPVINAAGGGSGEANTASNLGSGVGLFAQKAGVDLEFKGLVAGTNITLTPSSTGVTIAASGGGGGAVDSVNGQTGTVVLDAADVGADVAGAAAAAQAAAVQRANHTGTQAISTVSGLQTALDGKEATLVSGTNIKTVNGSSLLGTGDLVVASVPAAVTIESTATRVSEIGDATRFVVFENPAASTYTVEPQTSVAWAASAELQVYRKAAGTLTLTAGAGVTLKAGSGGTLVMTDGMAALIKRVGVDTWVVVGQTVPS